ncbi:MAG: bifunctional 4-hydroxy-2-oxoglutarate aldolase/2-dehydro-3-deoxy-phosphogluconate aldolase [Catenulispora sp.]|nr:bifunctional 4-hydroxy-2-oxoglutarate aldolase/2-dehydro-3-deoxy-phosphogluconate aldolase [Catenulispora sp.]
MTADIADLLRGARILPVLTVPETASALPLADALAEAGVSCAEVTLRTPQALDVLEAMAAHGGLTVGAGTVITPRQAERAVAAGAAFVVCPGLDTEVIATCHELGVPVLPGIATATELMRALSVGINTVKLFPAEQIGGTALLRALAAPFPQVRFVPTGGIGADNADDYFAEPSVLAVGGSWLTPAQALARGDYQCIRDLASQAVQRSTP